MPGILIVEDDPIHAILIKNVISNLGIENSHIDNGNAAITYARENNPDIIILDMNLPDMSGAEIIAALKQEESTAGIFILVVSADSEEANVVKALGLGASDYIKKPYNVAEFTIRLKNLLNLKISLEQVRYYTSKINDQKQKLSKYLSPALLDSILDGTIEARVGGSTQEIAILICDLRDSTTISEQVPADDLGRFLSDFFADISDLITGEKGSIISFRGDGLLAAFGTPEKLTNPALNAAKAAIKIHRHLEAYNSFRPDFLKTELKMGIGIATGKVFVGNIGSIHGLFFTVLGDAVNTAARLESLTKLAKVSTLIDGNTYDKIRDFVKVRKVKVENLRGKMQKVDVYALDNLNL
jgi:class 3 adenylate cyclase/CheY-like chemotaxis protein